MNSYLIFLRAINVSGKNCIKMDELKSVLKQYAFENISTYIQSGNIVLNSLLPKNEVQLQIESILKDHFQIQTDAFVYTFEELAYILENIPFSKDYPGNKVYITFFNQIPNDEQISLLKNLDFGEEEWSINQNILYFYLPNGMASSRWTNAFAEKKLGVKATGRNRNTLEKLITLKH